MAAGGGGRGVRGGRAGAAGVRAARRVGRAPEQSASGVREMAGVACEMAAGGCGVASLGDELVRGFDARLRVLHQLREEEGEGALRDDLREVRAWSSDIRARGAGDWREPGREVCATCARGVAVGVVVCDGVRRGDGR